MADDRARHLPLKRAESAAAFTLVVSLLAGGLALWLGVSSGSLASVAEGCHLLVGVLVWLVSLVHQRLKRLAAEEELVAEGVEVERGPSLFEGEGRVLTAGNRLAQFERYFLPAFSLAIAAALGAVAWYLLSRLSALEAPARVENALRNFWAFAGIAFVSFLLAKYGAGLATQAAWRPLRPAASYTMSCALGSFAVAVALVFCFFELLVVERVVAYAIPVLMAVLAGETVLLFVMGIYRPRVPGQELRAAHDSRILSMLITSRGILRTTAETLDYQFGFKVSETWFYRFMERAIGPLLVFQAATLLILSSLVLVGTEEEAVIERFGRPLRMDRPLGPGLHVKLPWPIDIARKYPTKRVHVLQIGEQLEETAPGFLWTKTHAKSPFNLLVANRQKQAPTGEEATEGRAPGVSMISGTVYVFYRVSNLYDFLYNHREPEEAFEAACYRELARYSANSDFIEFLGYKRAEAMMTLRQRIQSEADALRLGIEVVDLTLQGLHPPVQVASAFENVVGALEQKEAAVWRARGYANEQVPRAKAQAARVTADAEVYAADRLYVAPAVAEQFKMQLAASRVAPQIYRHRKLLSVLEEALLDVRKIVKPPWAKVRGVLYLDLKERLPGLGTLLETESSPEGSAP